MKKFKEALCFIVSLLLLFVLHGVLMAARLHGGMFMSGWHYFVLFLRDELFGMAVWNTYSAVLWPALLAAVIFAVLQYFVRKKIKISALVYYLVNIVAGSVAAFANVVFLSWQHWRDECVFPITTAEMVRQSIGVAEILLCLLAGILAAFVIWLGALVWPHVKKLLAKPRKVEA